MASEVLTFERKSAPHSTLRSKIETKEAVIGVVGLGYVGLPLVIEYATQGFNTIGFDVNEERVLGLNSGYNHIQDVDDGKLQEAVQRGRFRAEDAFDAIGEADIIFICVPTPVSQHKDPDTRYIEAATESIAGHLRAGQLVILKSTTYPNTTEGLVQPILEAVAKEQELQLGKDYFLAFSPERIDPGNKQFTTSNTPIVVGGVTDACTDMAALVLQQIVAEVHPVSSPKVAEMEKLLENVFRSANIALVNELAQLCDRMGDVSIWEVVDAAATKPFGYMPFYPGPGLGGHCIPIDPYYLSWLARKYDFETSFITLSARINEEMPFYVGNAVLRAVANQPVRLCNARVLILGVAFKRDVDDTRHSPAFKVMEILREQGVGHVDYSDPHVPQLEVETKQGAQIMDSVALSPETLRAYDVAVILTDHSAFPYAQIAQHAPAIVDARNALEDVPHNRDKVVLLGGDGGCSIG